MKTLLKFSGFISLVLVIVAVILLMATPGITYTVTLLGKTSTTTVEGTTVIFGKTESATALGFTVSSTTHPSVLALIGWILMVAGALLVCTAIVLPLIKKGEKFAGLLNLVAVIALVVAGVFVFIAVPTFCSANGADSVPEGMALGAGWVVAAILAIAGGAFAILPAAADFLSKK